MAVTAQPPLTEMLAFGQSRNRSVVAPAPLAPGEISLHVFASASVPSGGEVSRPMERQQAIRLALAQARGDADAQAAAMGMRVVRVVRVSERVGMSFMSLFLMAMAGDPGGRLAPLDAAEHATAAYFAVEFALAPL